METNALSLRAANGFITAQSPERVPVSDLFERGQLVCIRQLFVLMFQSIPNAKDLHRVNAEKAREHIQRRLGAHITRTLRYERILHKPDDC